MYFLRLVSKHSYKTDEVVNWNKIFNKIHFIIHKLSTLHYWIYVDFFSLHHFNLYMIDLPFKNYITLPPSSFCISLLVLRIEKHTFDTYHYGPFDLIDLPYFANLYRASELKQWIIVLQRFLSKFRYTSLPTAAIRFNWVTVHSECILRGLESITSRLEYQFFCVHQRILVWGYK